jgi:DivIVA domain-containing protein
LLIAAFILGVGGVIVFATAGERVSVVRWFFGGVGILLCLSFVVREVRPFRFGISADGLDLRARGIKRRVGWPEIAALVLVQPPRATADATLPSPRLLLVPEPGSDLQTRMTETVPPGGQAARLLLECDDVKEPVDEIAAALSRFGDARFTDARALGPATPAAGGFTTVLRGYDRLAVDELVRKGEQALTSGDQQHRQSVAEQIRGASFLVALRGYDRGQVDARLAQIAASLA